MNKTYKEFIESHDIISEDLFNELMESLPDAEVNFNNVDWFGDDIDDVSRSIIEEILGNWNYVYIDDINFKFKSFTLGDVYTLEDLDEIKETFYKWTIENYEELKEELLEDKKEEESYNKKRQLLKILENYSTEQLEKIVYDTTSSDN